MRSGRAEALACGLFRHLNSDLLEETAPRPPGHQGSIWLVATARGPYPGTTRHDCLSGHALTLAPVGRVSRSLSSVPDSTEWNSQGWKAKRRRCAMKTTPSASPPSEEASIKYVCGVDVGSQSCAGCICQPDKSVGVKSVTFANVRGIAT